MSQLKEFQTRPEFESADLEIDVVAAHRHIDEAMRGLTASESKEGKKYRTSDGMLVAIIGSSTGEGGDDTATLVYRTAPPSEQATRKAKKLLEALEPYIVG